MEHTVIKRTIVNKFSKKQTGIIISSVFSLITLSSEAMAEYATINNNEEREITHQWDLGNAGTLQVGRDTNGTLTVSSGGQINTNLLSIGRYAGDGEVNVINGGIITINNNNSYSYPLAIGGEGSSGGSSYGTKGILNIVGEGSQVIVNSARVGEMSVGSQGAEGQLNITDGGKLTAYIDRFYIGSRGSTDTKGVVIVDGLGSELYSSGRILIGAFNEGQVFISNGGTFKTDDLLTVGYTDVGTTESILVVSGEGSLAQSKNVTNIAITGKGTVVVSDQGTLSANQINIAQSTSSVGELAIGSRKGDAPTAAGNIKTDFIQFQNGQGTLVFNHLDNDFELKAAISGKGSVQAISGTTILSGVNTYTGITSIANGATLQAGATNTFSANATYDIEFGGTLNLNHYDQIIGNITNAGTVNLGGSSKNVGAVLTVAGDYIGNNGTLIFNGALNSDGDSVTDKLVITGNSSGNTKVRVNNIGGFGALTINGIDIIEVQGVPNAVFEQEGRIVAGAYDYFLTQGGIDDEGNLDQKWYLQSKFIPDEPGGSTGDGGPSGDGGSTGHVDTPNVVRPEAGAYLSLLEYNQSTFNHSFHDRQQLLDEQYQSAWVRVEYAQVKSKAANGQLKNKTEHTLVHFGSDVLQQDHIHFGVMGGYTEEDVNTTSSLSGYRAKAKSNGYSFGVYGTWYEQDKDNGGLYIDTYAQHNWFKNKVNGQDLPEMKLNTKSHTLSAEMGYGFHLGRLGNMAWQIEPQIQLVYNHHNGKTGVEPNGTRININKLDDFTSRAGVRFQGNSTRFKSFVTLNYWNHSKNATISMNDVSVESNRARDIFEVKTGGQIHLNNHVDLFTQISSS